MPASLQTLMPTVVTPSSQTFAADIDSDELNELIVFDTSISQMSVVHQFKYSDFTLNGISSTIWPSSKPGTTTPIWTSDTNPHWRTVWTSQEGSVPGGWQISPGDVIIPADLDGDGLGEFFVYNLYTLMWGILKWDSTANQFDTIYKVSVGPNQPAPPSGGLTWVGSVFDQYFIIPNIKGLISAAPANAAGILLYNRFTLAMGMVWYSTSASSSQFMQPWSHTGSSLNNWNLAANAPADNQFYPGNFAAAGTPSVVVYDPSDAYIALLEWDGQNFGAPYPGQNHNVGGWSFGSTNQFFVADMDGDGMTEIFVYAPDDQYLGILKWNTRANNFESFAITPGPIGTSPNRWTIGSNDQYFVMAGAAGTPAQILAFQPSSSTIALLRYQAPLLACDWAASSLLPNKGWPVTRLDSFYVASPSSALPPLFTMSNQGPTTSPTLTLGAVNRSGSALQIASSAALPILGWSPPFVADAPSTSFPPFTGDQAAIYTFISSLFPVPGQPGGPGGPIRSQYTNMVYKDKFMTYANDLNAVTTPSQIPSSWNPPANTWSTTDWQTVVNTIVMECNEVDTVYGMYDALSRLSSALNAFQEGDYDTVSANVQKLAQGNPPTVLDYWAGEIFTMSLWCMAASAAIVSGAGGVGLGVFMTAVASVLGAVESYNPTEPQSFAIQDLHTQITNTLSESIATQSLNLTIFLSDPVKLNICNGLSGNAWEIPSSLPSSMQGAFQAADRLAMYQELIPAYFSIAVLGQGGIEQPLFVFNNASYYLVPVVQPAQWQASAMYQDLFQTLGVSLEDFFIGLGPWSAIPRTTVLPGN